MTLPPNIVLVGFMGTGKSAVGQILARRLTREFVDLDDVVEKHAGCSVARLFASEGEFGFRKRERDAVVEIAARAGLVVATGGGVVLNPDNLLDLGTGGKLVCLTATPETVLARVGADGKRPLLQGGDPLARIRELFGQRAPIYRGIAIQVATDGLTEEAVASEVLRRLGGQGFKGSDLPARRCSPADGGAKDGGPRH